MGVLAYFMLPLVFNSNRADIKRLATLDGLLGEIRGVRNGETVKNEDFKAVTEKMAKVAKPIEAELKGLL